MFQKAHSGTENTVTGNIDKIPDNMVKSREGKMSSGQVKAEYDFEAQPGSGEMSITAGEILTVIRR
ncbi:hypothetical protein ANCCEY_14962, partial [Ancylostoma ceylanicum]